MLLYLTGALIFFLLRCIAKNSPTFASQVISEDILVCRIYYKMSKLFYGEIRFLE